MPWSNRDVSNWARTSQNQAASPNQPEAILPSVHRPPALHPLVEFPSPLSTPAASRLDHLSSCRYAAAARSGLYRCREIVRANPKPCHHDQRCLVWSCANGMTSMGRPERIALPSSQCHLGTMAAALGKSSEKGAYSNTTTPSVKGGRSGSQRLLPTSKTALRPSTLRRLRCGRRTAQRQARPPRPSVEDQGVVARHRESGATPRASGVAVVVNRTGSL